MTQKSKPTPGPPNCCKWCPLCSQVKQFSEFSVKNGRTGQMKINSSCKECDKKVSKAWRQSKAAIAKAEGK